MAVAVGPMVRRQRAAGWLAAIGVAVMVYGTLLPLTFDWSRGPWAQERVLATLGWSLPGVEDAVVNVVICLPLGVLLCWRLTGWAVPSVVRVAAVTVAIGLMSYTVESLQSMLPGRVPAWSDVALNTLAGWLGAMLAAPVSLLTWLVGKAMAWSLCEVRRSRRWPYEWRLGAAIAVVLVQAGIALGDVGSAAGSGGTSGTINLLPFAVHFNQPFATAVGMVVAQAWGYAVLGLIVGACFGLRRPWVAAGSSVLVAVMIAGVAIISEIQAGGGADVTSVLVAGAGAAAGALAYMASRQLAPTPATRSANAPRRCYVWRHRYTTAYACRRR